MQSNSEMFPSRRIWLVSVIVGAGASIPVALLAERVPWLIAVPIILGSAIAIAWEIRSEAVISETPSSSKIIPATTHGGSRPIGGPNNLLQAPVDFMPLAAPLYNDVDAIIAGKGKLLLKGQIGSGKTTFALEICRRQLNAVSQAKANQSPIFIPLSQAQRRNGLDTMFVDEISQSLKNEYPNGDARAHAKRMIKKGSLLLVIDDLDYLGKRGQKELENFIRRWNANSYVCIISERPPYPFLQEFESIEIPEWAPTTVKSYIERRISEPSQRAEMIHTLERGRVLERSLTAWQARFLVDKYIEGSFYKLIEIGGEERHTDFGLLDRYLRIVLESAQLEYSDSIKQLGRLSLRLLKRGRSSFVWDDKLGIDQTLLQSLAPKLFKQQEGKFTFVHGNYQVFLAGRYLGNSWTEAKAELKDDDARKLIWTPVYNCAFRFIPEREQEDLNRAFQGLVVAQR